MAGSGEGVKPMAIQRAFLSGSGRALIPDDGHEQTFHRLKHGEAQQDEQKAKSCDRGPAWNIRLENDPVKDGRC